MIFDYEYDSVHIVHWKCFYDVSFFLAATVHCVFLSCFIGAYSACSVLVNVV